MRTIKSEQQLKQGVQELIQLCPKMAVIYEDIGDPPLRWYEEGFRGLLRIIIGQQLSVASASTIWARFEKAVQPLSAKRILKLGADDFKAAGISAPKQKTLKAVSHAIVTQDLKLEEISQMSEEDVVDALVQISGIGPWTANVYCMFCLARADAWAPGDLALQYAVQDLFDLKDRPKPDEMIEIAEIWRPVRSVAARLLWAYYLKQKQNAKAAPI